MALKLENSNFESFIKESSIPVLVDFYSDSCIPCRRIAPLLSKAESDYTERLHFVKVNIAANSELLSKYSVEAVPTLIVFKEGIEIKRHIGAADAETLNEFIESVL